MGQAVCEAVEGAEDMALTGRADPQLATELASVLEDADVAVEFSTPATVVDNVRACVDAGVHAVVGATGYDPDELRAVAEAGDANVFVAPNFAIGAVLMMKFSELAAPWFETVEIIELHHDNKIDAPSGTAMKTAERIAAASSDWAADPTTAHVLEGARGGHGPAGIPIHAVRLRGLFAHQEVLFGTAGQSLSIRHDTYDRTCYMPGVLLAVKQVGSRPGLTIGIEPLLGLD